MTDRQYYKDQPLKILVDDYVYYYRSQQGRASAIKSSIDNFFNLQGKEGSRRYQFGLDTGYIDGKYNAEARRERKRISVIIDRLRSIIVDYSEINDLLLSHTDYKGPLFPTRNI